MKARPDDTLEARLARLTLVLKNAPVILYGLDLRGRFLFSEGNGMAAMGLKKGQIVGDSAFDLYKETPGAEKAIRLALEGQHSVFRAHFGGAYFVSRLTPILDEEGRVKQVVGVSVDTGAQMRAEEELSQRSDRERQARKMEAMGQLAGGIAHDFNNLLTAIIGYCDLLTMNSACQAQSVAGDVGQIRRAAERAAALTRQILAFSRLQPLQPQTASLNDALRDGQVLLRRTLGELVDLEYVMCPDLGLVDVDLNQMEQVIMNLAVNARDAMPGGGRLRIETANVELDSEFCWTNPDCAPGPHVMLVVSDQGIGMDEETMSRIFEPFFTTKGVGEGTGLGLSTVYGIVRQSGGVVLADSQLGRGTTFKLYFPRVEHQADMRPAVVAPQLPADVYRAVMVVEDEPVLRDLITRVLASAGYLVYAAIDASQALSLLEEAEPEIDLLLTDVVLPGGMQGDDLAREALVLRPGLPVLYMSGHPREALMDSGFIDAGIDYLPKPFAPDQLIDRVRKALDAAKK